MNPQLKAATFVGEVLNLAIACESQIHPGFHQPRSQPRRVRSTKFFPKPIRFKEPPLNRCGSATFQVQESAKKAEDIVLRKA